MPLSTRVSGAWKNISTVSVRVNGVWKTCKQIYVKVNGAWKKCILTSGSHSVDAPIRSGSSVTLSDAKIGTYIKITGTVTPPSAVSCLVRYNLTNCNASYIEQYFNPISSATNFDLTIGDQYAKVTAVPVTVTPASNVYNYYTWYSNVKITYTREGYFD